MKYTPQEAVTIALAGVDRALATYDRALKHPQLLDEERWFIGGKVTELHLCREDLSALQGRGTALTTHDLQLFCATLKANSLKLLTETLKAVERPDSRGGLGALYSRIVIATELEGLLKRERREPTPPTAAQQEVPTPA